MLHWWCITSAGDITMSTVLNMRDGTFMCEAIKSDEARPGGIGRKYIQPLFLSNSFPLTSFHHLYHCFFSTAHLTSSHFFLCLAKNTVLSNIAKHCHLLFDLLLSPSVSHFISPPQIISVSLYPLSACLSQSCLISVDLAVFNLSTPSAVCLTNLIVCNLLFCSFWYFFNHLHCSVFLSVLTCICCSTVRCLASFCSFSSKAIEGLLGNA